MSSIGVDAVGIHLMASKLRHLNLKIEGLTCPQANILKQEMLSIGGEAAVAKGVITCDISGSDAILSGTEKQLQAVIKKLNMQPFGLKKVAIAIKSALDNIYQQEIIFETRKQKLLLGKQTLIMGILNVTPDSFYDGGHYFKKGNAVNKALQMAEEGADIIDVGGESSRPGSKAVTLKEELTRVMPVVKQIAKRSAVLISVDTTKAEVAEQAIDAGADIINDVSAMRFDPNMARVCAKNKTGVILMHMRGTPATMQMDIHYNDIISDIFNYLAERVSFAVKGGVRRERIAIDPGIGFGKNIEGNLEIIKRLSEFNAIGRPIVIGTSRKSFIGKVLGLETKDRLEGSIATIAASVLNGAHIVRVHDVKEARMAADMVDAIKKS
ncbi:MAG: dihydropteroate synthase [Deltaproteobacteria bacterium RIFCSPLOWO2_12_FULL_43_16]|nr:MAG: dihydropteroate synthase [Deltaproteobacteria bacterium GWA2_43_19]OGQ09950.1 MAG: dihydropteroate synthase [Deltaproteobacteria bacterium RIFCSPHIGHO2_02_FULL_43_33]OGQ58474.1 MAG: dihydropteroate synthase [Deltaproteobacteria bacterium RIFCSPLOWO2_12_FULL_43_16]HBR16732.1 dihydropteroate synthase [Deltaproteobacteria bacterium]